MKNTIKNAILIVFCLYSLFFVAGSILAPITASIGAYEISAKLTSTYMFSCHQQANKCFWVLGYPVALCCRCLGFYLGVVISTILELTKELNISIKLIIIFTTTAIIDILINMVLKIDTGLYTRFFVGILMGCVFTSIICKIFRKKKGEKDCDYQKNS